MGKILLNLLQGILKYSTQILSIIEKLFLWYRSYKLIKVQQTLEKYKASKRTLDEVKKIHSRLNTDSNFAKRVREKSTRD